MEQKVAPNGFQYVKQTEPHDIAVRRVGVYAGKAFKKDGTSFSVQSHYFLKFDAHAIPHLDQIIHQINAHVFPSNTVGPRSLSKSEVNFVLNSIVLNLCSS
jgi:hypothetical protein